MAGTAVQPSVTPEPGVNSDLAAHLIAQGRVQVPESAAWEAELLGLMAQAQRRLTSSSSVFLMGQDHVGLFLITRDDLIAVAPHLGRTFGAAASRHRRPRTAVRPVADRTDSWAVKPARASPFREFSTEFPVYQDVAAEPAAPASAGEESAGEESAEDSAAVSAEVVDEQVAPVLAGLGPRRGEGAVAKSPIRRALVAAAVVGGVAAGAGLVATVIADGGSDRAPRPVAAPVPTPVQATAVAIPRPAALEEIAKPVASYVPPRAAPQRTHRPAPRPRPRGRWLPNPIPGLPPIPLP